ncbi:hypothetical protein [Ornithinimicrobium faecis]|uniref:Uncharacterized protein n=1 Tax=Ornithinimicrobium faecis TaxID=2934158 RepID=A0ABY4YQC4_9MICO|nr:MULTISPECIES: hypothetical protein [unclassified Ornithinimicrobium]USQ78946.1 hypothetical protein NF556_15110 [Ornithinimicrobium sp. HY1793]
MFRRRSLTQANDLLGVPGPIVFQGVPHELHWIEFGQLGWIPEVGEVPIQMYLPAGQDLESYTWQFSIRMLPLTPPREVMMARGRSLDARSEIDPIVNYQAIWDEGRDDDICMDYLVSHPSGTAFEWTAERWVPWRHLTACYVVSRRAYGEGARSFLEGLSTHRPAAIAALREMSLPQITRVTPTSQA